MCDAPPTNMQCTMIIWVTVPLMGCTSTRILEFILPLLVFPLILLRGDKNENSSKRR